VVWITLIVSLFLAVIHIHAEKLRHLRKISHNRWLSLAGGVSVAFVFVDILPLLSEGEAMFLERVARGEREGFKDHAYLVALLGLVVFYGLEQFVLTSHLRKQGRSEDVPAGVFWAHLGLFALYNFIIGYLLVHRHERGAWSLATYSLAVGLHSVVSDFGLRKHQEHLFHVSGRWMLALALIAGWAFSIIADLSEPVVIFFYAFLAGGLIMSVLKEELPRERENSFWAFVLGCAIYAVLVILT